MQITIKQRPENEIGKRWALVNENNTDVAYTFCVEAAEVLAAALRSYTGGCVCVLQDTDDACNHCQREAGR